MTTQTATRTQQKTQIQPQVKKNQEYDIEGYMKEFGYTVKDLKTDDFWSKLPKNHQPLMCMEGMIYGFLVRFDGINFK